MHQIAARAYSVFEADAAAPPATSLRGGAAIDSYADPPPFDPEVDKPTDEYVRTYTFDGLNYLDAQSWRHYLPRLIEYALDCRSASLGMAVEGLLWSLRPPDRVPPRLGSLSKEQEEVVVSFLEHLAFSDEAVPERELVLQVMEEWWIPGALYRPDSEADA